MFQDPATGVTGAIAIHSLARCRSKSAVADLDLGGGKAVLLDDGEWGDAREERMRAAAVVVSVDHVPTAVASAGVKSLRRSHPDEESPA